MRISYGRDKSYHLDRVDEKIRGTPAAIYAAIARTLSRKPGEEFFNRSSIVDNLARAA